jgi:hypothetical protein
MENKIKQFCFEDVADVGDLSTRWLAFKRRVLLYFTLPDNIKLTDEHKIAILLNSIDDKGLQIYDNFNV